MTAGNSPKEHLPVGRPTKYLPDYCELLLEFFRIPLTEMKEKEVVGKLGVVTIKEEEACELPMLVDFAEHIGVDTDTIVEWSKVHSEFSVAYKKAKKLQEQIIVKNAFKGRYNTTFSLFFLKCNAGWNDKAAEQEGASDKDRSINVNLYNASEEFPNDKEE